MRIIYAVPIVLAALICAPRVVDGQELRDVIHRLDDCCDIVSVDRMSNQIVVREIATGRTKTLTIANNELLQKLQPGAAFGPGSIDGIQEAPGVFEPNWADECCTFRAHAQGQTNVGTTAQAIVPAGTIQKIEECCTIVSVDRTTNQIIVREIATGRTKTLTIANNELLQQLEPGAAFGPGSIDGIQEAPGVFEPNWVEECCTFRALAQGQTNAGRAKQLNTAGGMSARGMTVDLGPDVTITLQSLKRLGSRVVRLDFSVRNDTGDRAFMPDYGLFGGYHHSLRYVSVLDYDAGLRYGAIVDSKDICACSRGSTLETVGAGQESRYWVQIKAPPVDVNVVSIDFAGRASIDNVPIAP